MPTSPTPLTVLLHAHDTRGQLRALKRAMAILRCMAQGQTWSGAPLRAYILHDQQLEQLSRLPMARQWRVTSGGFTPLTQAAVAEQRELERELVERELATSGAGALVIEGLATLSRFEELWRELADRPSARQLLMPAMRAGGEVHPRKGLRVMVVLGNAAQFDLWQRMRATLSDRTILVVLAIHTAAHSLAAQLRRVTQGSVCDECTVEFGQAGAGSLGTVARRWQVDLVICFVDFELTHDPGMATGLTRADVEVLVDELPCPLLVVHPNGTHGDDGD